MTAPLYLDSDVLAELIPLERLFALGPQIRPDLSKLGMKRMPMFILALMVRGYRTADAIFDYLVDRGSRIDHDTLDEILSRHHGIGQVDDDIYDGLWSADRDGGYTPNFTVDGVATD